MHYLVKDKYVERKTDNPAQKKLRYFAIMLNDGKVEIRSVRGRLKATTSTLHIKGANYPLRQVNYEGGETVKIMSYNDFYYATRLSVRGAVEITTAMKNKAVDYKSGY